VRRFRLVGWIALWAASLVLGCGGGSGGGAGGAGVAGGAGAGGVGGGIAAGAGGGNAGASGAGGSSGGASGAAGGRAGAAGGQSGASGGHSGAPGGQTGAVGSGGDVGTGSGGAAGSAVDCQSEPIAFTPRAPTVLILVDRSSSSGTYSAVRAAVEQVVSSFQHQVRFGLLDYVGDDNGESCQLLGSVIDPAIDNALGVKALYDSLGTVPSAITADRPAVQALPMVQAALQGDTGGGNKFLLWVTTGDTDFCDAADERCSADAVTYQLQRMYGATPSIGARIVGLPVSTATGIQPTVLQNFANAGAGQPAVVPMAPGETQTITPADIYGECVGMTDGGAQSWSTLYTVGGRTAPSPLAVYGTPTPAPLFMAASTSTADVTTALDAALSSLGGSCAFDLSSFTIDPAKLAEGSVTIDGTMIAQSAADGWSMPSDTELVLNGAACTAARQATSIEFHFPCDAIRTPN